jgi:hypothetical protein
MGLAVAESKVLHGIDDEPEQYFCQLTDVTQWA